MTAAPSYYVEAQHEPGGPGSGWHVAPDDRAASVFCVIGPRGEVIASRTTRRSAESIISALTAERHYREANPGPPPPPPPRFSTGQLWLMVPPAVLIAWAICGAINGMT